MDWQGRIFGSDRIWGADGASRLFVVGAPDVPAGPGTGWVCADSLPETSTGFHLPAMGAIPAPERLALIGFLALNPHWDGVAVVVGDSAVWATLSAREVIHQQGSATPVLARALGLDDAAPVEMDTARDRPERLPLLLHDARSAGSKIGTLLGAEIGATRTLWLGQQAVGIGTGALAKAYVAALRQAHVPVTETDRTALFDKGFAALAAQAL